MENILIDPHILLLDLENTNKSAEAEKFIDILMDAQSLHFNDNLNPLISEATLDFVDQYMEYPHWNNIKEFLILNGLQDDYQPQDILSAFQKIVSSQTIESTLNIQELLFEIEKFSIFGAQLSDFEKIEELQNIIVYTSLVEKLMGPTHIFSKGNFNAEIIYVIKNLKPLINDFEVPYSTSNIINAYSSIEQVYKRIDCFNLWKCINFDNFFDDSKKIIDLYLTQNKMNSMNEFYFSKDFVYYIKKFNFKSDDTKIKMLFRALSEVISGNSLEKTHSLRINSSGDSKQREYNNFKAFRHDIDREFHLHYWKKESKIIFASLGPHNQYEIPNPS